MIRGYHNMAQTCSQLMGIPYSLFTGSLFLRYPLRPGRLLRCTGIVEPFGDICYSSVHYLKRLSYLRRERKKLPIPIPSPNLYLTEKSHAAFILPGNAYFICIAGTVSNSRAQYHLHHGGWPGLCRPELLWPYRLRRHLTWISWHRRELNSWMRMLLRLFAHQPERLSWPAVTRHARRWTDGPLRWGHKDSLVGLTPDTHLLQRC